MPRLTYYDQIDWARGIRPKDYYEWAVWIDYTTQKGLVHYRTRAGEILRTLDEVVRAILADDLEVEQPS